MPEPVHRRFDRAQRQPELFSRGLIRGVAQIGGQERSEPIE
jgi:hypothetical protein